MKRATRLQKLRRGSWTIFTNNVIRQLELNIKRVKESQGSSASAFIQYLTDDFFVVIKLHAVVAEISALLGWAEQTPASLHPSAEGSIAGLLQFRVVPPNNLLRGWKTSARLLWRVLQATMGIVMRSGHEPWSAPTAAFSSGVKERANKLALRLAHASTSRPDVPWMMPASRNTNFRATSKTA